MSFDVVSQAPGWTGQDLGGRVCESAGTTAGDVEVVRRSLVAQTALWLGRLAGGQRFVGCASQICPRESPSCKGEGVQVVADRRYVDRASFCIGAWAMAEYLVEVATGVACFSGQSAVDEDTRVLTLFQKTSLVFRFRPALLS